MLIISKQGNSDNLYAIWSTVTDRFIGVNMKYDDCIRIIMEYKWYTYEDARERVDYPQPFHDIAERIYMGLGPYYATEEQMDIKNAVRIVANHYAKDEYFRNAFRQSVAGVLKEIPVGTGLYDIARAVSDRVMGR